MTNSAQRQRERRAAMLARGLCVQCEHRPHNPGIQRCETCRVAQLEYCKERRQERRKAGLIDVPPLALPPKVKRRRQAETPSDRRLRLAAAGKCVCGRPKPVAEKRCPKCSETGRLNQRRKRWSGATIKLDDSHIEGIHAAAELLRDDGSQRVSAVEALAHALRIFAECHEQGRIE